MDIMSTHDHNLFNEHVKMRFNTNDTDSLTDMNALLYFNHSFH